MNPQDEALKPCPFCNGEMMPRHALWPSDGDKDAIIHKEPTTCGMVSFSIGTADEGGSVASAWNTRLSHSTPGDAEVREAARTLISAAEAAGTAFNTTMLDDAIEGMEKALATPSGRAQGEVRKALEKCRKGWLTAIEFGIILPQHRAAAQVLADAAASALATPCAQAWLPIETAPKDGSEVLCFGRQWGFSPVRFVAVWNGVTWYAGWGDSIQPTYWQPLPAAPPAQVQTKGDEA